MSCVYFVKVSEFKSNTSNLIYAENKRRKNKIGLLECLNLWLMYKFVIYVSPTKEKR